MTYADLECLVKRIEGCANNPQKSSSIKIGEHIPCRYSMSIIWGFKHIKIKYSMYRGKDCMKKFCESLKQHATIIIGFKKKKRLPLTNKELKTHKDTKICYIFRKSFIKKPLQGYILSKSQRSLSLYR